MGYVGVTFLERERVMSEEEKGTDRLNKLDLLESRLSELEDKIVIIRGHAEAVATGMAAGAFGILVGLPLRWIAGIVLLGIIVVELIRMPFFIKDSGEE